MAKQLAVAVTHTHTLRIKPHGHGGTKSLYVVNGYLEEVKYEGTHE